MIGKILFVGNSHTYFNEMPHTVGELFRLNGLEVPEIVENTYPGMDLGTHLGQPQVQFNIKYGKYDFVVLQDVAHPFIGKKKLLSDVEGMMKTVKQAGSQGCLYMTWASKAEPEVQEEMTDSYTEASVRTGALLARVGEVWKEIRAQHPEINLFWQDGQHAGIYGSLISAMMIFRAITGIKEAKADWTDAFFKEYDAKTCEIIRETCNRF